MVTLTEKHRPKTFAELVGNEDSIKEATDLLQNNKTIILAGPPGTGKTSFAHVYANVFGYSLNLTNASDERRKDDIREIERALKTKPLFPTLTVLDEVDGVKEWNQLIHIIKKTKNPLIMTCNEKRKIPKEVFKFAKLIEMKPLKPQDVVKRIRQIAEIEKMTPDLSKITQDLRESINRVFYNSDTYERERSDFDKVDDIFKHKTIHDIEPIWLIDNLSNYYNASEIVDAIEVIKVYKRLKNPEVLRSLPVAKYGKPTYPSMWRLMKHG